MSLEESFHGLLQRLTGLIGVGLGELVVLALLAVAGSVVASALSFAGRRLGSDDEPRLLGTVTRHCSKVLHLLLPVLAVSIGLNMMGTEDGLAAVLPRVLSIVSIALSGWLVVNVIRGTVAYVVETNSIQQADNLHARQIQTQIRLLGRVLIFVVIIATIGGVLVSIPSIRNIGVSLFASAGIAGIAVGLAARPTLGNLIAGLQIAITQPIRLDDAVVVEGEWGWVEEITMTFVVVRIWDLRRLVLPISYFIEQPFENWTRTRADILGSVVLYMDYTVPVAEVRAEFSRALRDSEYWDGKVEVVHVIDCTEKTVQVRLLMSAANSPNAWELRCAVRERIITFLQENYPESLPRLRLAGAAATGELAET